jgi:hypothetical protein
MNKRRNGMKGERLVDLCANEIIYLFGGRIVLRDHAINNILSIQHQQFHLHFQLLLLLPLVMGIFGIACKWQMAKGGRRKEHAKEKGGRGGELTTMLVDTEGIQKWEEAEDGMDGMDGRIWN